MNVVVKKRVIQAALNSLETIEGAGKVLDALEKADEFLDSVLPEESLYGEEEEEEEEEEAEDEDTPLLF